MVMENKFSVCEYVENQLHTIYSLATWLSMLKFLLQAYASAEIINMPKSNIKLNLFIISK
jgi:hypothetical protein